MAVPTQGKSLNYKGLGPQNCYFTQTKSETDSADVYHISTLISCGLPSVFNVTNKGLQIDLWGWVIEILFPSIINYSNWMTVAQIKDNMSINKPVQINLSIYDKTFNY